MEPNHEFCRDAVLARLRDDCCTAGRVLDYGCGAGQVVKALRDAGVDAYGADAFYQGGNSLKRLENDPLFLSGVIRRMSGDQTDFDSATFDLAVSNQVLEHVEDLNRVLDELYRVLKPGGAVLSLFPDKGVWREGHCGIPFLHRFPKGSRARTVYAFTLRSCGFGYFKDGRTRWDWSRNFCQWLDNWTYYRTLDEIHASFQRRFTQLEHIEDTYLAYRLRRSSLAPLATISRSRMIRPASRVFLRKMMGLVFWARKGKELPV